MNVNTFGRIQKYGLKNWLIRVSRFRKYKLDLDRLRKRHLLNATHAQIFGRHIELSKRRSGLTEELILYGLHEPACTEAYLSHLKPGDTVCEVGTNIGYYAYAAESRIGPSGFILGFEPDPELHSIASRNLDSLPCHTEVLNLAVSNNIGTATFYRSEVGNWGSMVKHDQLNQSGSIQVSTTTIDDAVKELDPRPRILRMDIEGHELHAIRGAVKTLSSSVETFFLELHVFMLSTEEREEIMDTLIHAGFSSALVIDRFFDVPWASKRTVRQLASKMDLKSAKSELCNEGALPVTGLLITK